MSRCWVGTSRRRRSVRPIVGLMVGAAVIAAGRLLLPISGPGCFQLVGSLGLVEVVLVAGLLHAWRVYRPVALTVSDHDVCAAQGGRTLAVALTDVDWAASVVSNDTVMLEQHEDPQSGPRPSLEVDMFAFAPEQRRQIHATLAKVRAAAARSRSGRHSGPCRGLPRVRRDWRGRSAVGVQIMLGAALLVTLACVLAFSGAFMDGRLELLGWAIVVLGLIGSLLTALWIRRIYGPITITVNDVGLHIRRGWRTHMIAFAEIASLTLVHTGDPSVSIGSTADSPYLLIDPRPDYYTRTRTRPPHWLDPRWRIYRERFAQSQFSEIKAVLARHVKASGGKYISGECDIL